MNPGVSHIVQSEREALARVKALHPEPRLTIAERPELRFVSIGCAAGGSVTFPMLGFYAVSLRVGGTAYLREDSWRRGPVRSPAGSVFVQALNSSVEYAWQREHVSWGLCVDAAELEQAVQEDGTLNPRRIEIVSRGRFDATAAHMVRALAAQAAVGAHPGQTLACAALRKAMALHLLAHYGVFAPQKRAPRAGLPRLALSKGIAYLEDNLARDCTLDELAAEIGVSVFHVNELFQRATGETPAAYVERVRVERAKDVLRRGRVDPQQLAASVGFADVNVFRRVFSRVTGVSLEQFAALHGTILDCIPPVSGRPS